MSRRKKPHGLYATKDGGSNSVWVWLGKPAQDEESCSERGKQRLVWTEGRGCKALLKDVCESGFAAAGITFPGEGGMVKFKVVVEE